MQSDDSHIEFDIPEDLQKEGRTHYLVTSDEDGITILKNESNDSTKFASEKGKADTTYQIIYEDEETPLASMIGDDGTLMAEDETVSCFNHWVILGLTVFGLVAALILGKREKKSVILVAAATTIGNLVFAIFGSCNLDWIFMLCEIVLMVLTYLFFIRKKDDEDKETVTA